MGKKNDGLNVPGWRWRTGQDEVSDGRQQFLVQRVETVDADRESVFIACFCLPVEALLSPCMGFSCTVKGFPARRCFAAYPAGVEVGRTLTARVAVALCIRRIRFSISAMPRLTIAASTMNVQSDGPIGAV